MGKIPPIKMSWDEATKYADSLNTMSEYGWRLPTIEELEEAYNNKIVEFQSYSYWSSITYVQNTNYAWNVDFSNGFVDFNDKTDDYYVRCVRGVK